MDCAKVATAPTDGVGGDGIEERLVVSAENRAHGDFLWRRRVKVPPVKQQAKPAHPCPKPPSSSADSSPPVSAKRHAETKLPRPAPEGRVADMLFD